MNVFNRFFQVANISVFYMGGKTSKGKAISVLKADFKYLQSTVDRTMVEAMVGLKRFPER